MFIAIWAGCTGLGALCGGALYLLATAAPWLSSAQRDLVFFGLLGIGFVIGLASALYDLIKNWGHVTLLTEIDKNARSRLREGDG